MKLTSWEGSMSVSNAGARLSMGCRSAKLRKCGGDSEEIDTCGLHRCRFKPIAVSLLWQHRGHEPADIHGGINQSGYCLHCTLAFSGNSRLMLDQGISRRERGAACSCDSHYDVVFYEDTSSHPLCKPLSPYKFTLAIIVAQLRWSSAFWQESLRHFPSW